MPEDNSPEAQFLAHLEDVRQVVRFASRRVGLTPEEASDCGSWVELRLIENDYAQLRKFRGESSFRTFITVVVTMLVRDYRTQLHGKWRPSASAARLGAIAIWLERLLYRDGIPFEQAARTIQSGSGISPADRELRDLQRQLPVRPPLRPDLVDVDVAADLATSERADANVEASERYEMGVRLRMVLASEIERLSEVDRVALQMDVVDGVQVASISRALGLPQRPLYDRLKAVRRTLKSRLESAGVSQAAVQAYLGTDDS